LPAELPRAVEEELLAAFCVLLLPPTNAAAATVNMLGRTPEPRVPACDLPMIDESVWCLVAERQLGLHNEIMIPDKLIPLYLQTNWMFLIPSKQIEYSNTSIIIN